MQRRREEFFSFWNEQRALVETFLAAPPEGQPFLRKLLPALGLEAGYFPKFVRQNMLEFESSLACSRMERTAHGEIPLLTHRIWLTAADKPSLPPDSYLENYLGSLQRLPAEMTHFFWTNSPAVVDLVMSRARAADVANVGALETRLLATDVTMSRVDALISDRKFVLAADLLKFVILVRFGGIYSDLGIIYDELVVDLIRTANYAFIVGNSEFFQTSFFACPAHSDLASIFLAVMNVPSAFDARYALLGATPVALDEVNMFAGLGLTACAILYLPRAIRALMLPAQSKHFLHVSLKSWYGSEAQYGNRLIKSASPTLIQAEDFQRADDLFRNCVQIHGDLPFLAGQLRVLLGLCDYFSTRATAMDHAFYFHGSDKALQWHNYAYLYNFLLGTMRVRVRGILEVGRVRKNAEGDVDIRFCGIAGALRAWKKSFPLAAVVGASNDEVAGMHDATIQTYRLDQNDPGAVSDFFNAITERHFDLIIDDGLHTFAANTALLEQGYARLTDNGFYIVEDIADSELSAWNTYLINAAVNAAIVRIPHALNKLDNRIIIIPGGQRLFRA